jgi:hypothetical protein
MLARERTHFVVVDQFGVFAHAVRDRVVELTAEADLRPVREVTAVIDLHAEHGIARLEHRHEHGHVRLGAGMRLYVGVIRSEDFLRPLDRERLGDVDELAAAVVAFADVALGVLIGQDRARRFAYCATRVVLRRDQLEVLALPPLLALDCREEFGIARCEHRFV